MERTEADAEAGSASTRTAIDRTPAARSAAKTDAVAGGRPPPPPPSTITSVSPACQRTTPGTSWARRGGGAWAATTAARSDPAATANPTRCATDVRRRTPASGELSSVCAPRSVAVGRAAAWRARASPPARPITWGQPRAPSGRWAHRVATPASQPSARRVGTCSRGATTGTTPASSPPVRPHIITSPAAGTARRFAGSDATGIGPNAARRTGATPSCAAIVTDSADRIAGGPGRT